MGTVMVKKMDDISTIPAQKWSQNIPNGTLPTCTGDIICGQSLCSSDWLMELQYLGPAHMAVVNHDVSALLPYRQITNYNQTYQKRKLKWQNPSLEKTYFTCNLIFQFGTCPIFWQEYARVMTSTAASHKGAIEMFRLPFWGADGWEQQKRKLVLKFWHKSNASWRRWWFKLTMICKKWSQHQNESLEI